MAASDYEAHGTETCPACGGYTAALGVLGKNVVSRCRGCGMTSSQPKGNDLDYFLNATAEDYE